MSPFNEATNLIWNQITELPPDSVPEMLSFIYYSFSHCNRSTKHWSQWNRWRSEGEC